jgi:23S rRNA (adenine2030-N6)-methyltransferase
VLVDPPFERGDDYQQAADLAKEVLRRKRNAVLAIWTPLKDLETFDAFVRRLEQGVDEPLLAAEVRLRALDNPMQLNGCALVFLNPPKGLGPALKPALDWIVGRGVDLGGGVRLWTAGA